MYSINFDIVRLATPVNLWYNFYMEIKGSNIAKFFSYIIVKIAFFAIAVAFIIGAFYVGQNTMQVNVTVKDAFSKRATCILKPVDADGRLMRVLFTEQYLETSGLLIPTGNTEFNITYFYQRTDVPVVVIFPWQTKTEIEVTDEVLDISSTYLGGADSDLIYSKLPQYQNAVWLVRVIKVDGVWVIDDMELKEKIAEQTPAPTPTPTTSPEEIIEEPPTDE